MKASRRWFVTGVAAAMTLFVTLPAAADVAQPNGDPIALSLPDVPAEGLHPVQPIPTKDKTDTSCATVAKRVAAERAAQSAALKAKPRTFLCDGTPADLAVLSPSPMHTATALAGDCGPVQDVTDPVLWLARSRFDACLDRLAITVSFNTSTGFDDLAIMQTEQDILASNTQDPTTAFWVDNVALTFIGYTGDFSQIEVDFTTDCNCRIEISDHLYGGFASFTLGQTRSGSFVYSLQPSGGTEVVSGWTFSYEGRRPGVISVGPATIDGPIPMRCHAKSAGKYTGCVFPTYMPEVQVPIALYGAAAWTVAFGNYYLPDGWGYAQPIQRLSNEGVANMNRDFVCDNSFIRYPTIVPDDSCDEYAFASSYQSGRLLGVPSGQACAEVMILFNGATGQWELYQPGLPVTQTERCVRAHVPQGLNSAVGAFVVDFLQANHVLDFEQYYVYAV